MRRPRAPGFQRTADLRRGNMKRDADGGGRERVDRVVTPRDHEPYFVPPLHAGRAEFERGAPFTVEDHAPPPHGGGTRDSKPYVTFRSTGRAARPTRGSSALTIAVVAGGGGKRSEEFRLFLGDPVHRSEELEVLAPDPGDQSVRRGERPAEPGDLAGMIGADFDDGHLVFPVEPEDRHAARRYGCSGSPPCSGRCISLRGRWRSSPSSSSFRCFPRLPETGC